MKLIWMPLALSFLSVNSHAIEGKNINPVNERDFPTVCKLVIKDLGSCTGTLVAPNKIYTAAHCFRKDYFAPHNPVTITCGDQLNRSTSVEIPPSAQWETEESPNLNSDFAVVNLMFNSPIPPNPVASGPELYFDAKGHILPGVTCSILGYGDADLRGAS